MLAKTGDRVKRGAATQPAASLPRQGMQNIDRPAHAQTFSQPARRRGVRVQDEPLSIVPRAEDLHGIAAHLGRRRDLGQKLAVRAAEPKLAICPSIELVAVLVNRAVVAPAEQGEIRWVSRAALGPVTDVMALPEPDPALREAAAAIPVVERPA